MGMPQRILSLLLLLLPAFAQEGRTVVLGFDGADARTVQRLMDAGRLPHLSQLARQGTFAPLRSMHPAESAAGWAAIHTGANPLVNGVGGFLRRSKSGRPTVELAHVEVHPERLAPRPRKRPWIAAVGVGLLVALILVRWLRRPALAIAAALAACAAMLGWGPGGGPAPPRAVPAVYSGAVQAETFWDAAARAGKRAIVLEAAMAFGEKGASEEGGSAGTRVLAGLGFPDAIGQMNGAWKIYTTDEGELVRPPKGTPTKTGTGAICRIEERDGRVKTRLYGPADYTRHPEAIGRLADIDDELQSTTKVGARRELEMQSSALKAQIAKEQPVSVDLSIEHRGSTLAIRIDGTTHEAGAGEWTDWYAPVFRLSDGFEIHALTRVRVLSVSAPLTIYIEPLQIDPEYPLPWQPVSSPPDFSGELVDWSGGRFKTVGWGCLTNQIKDRALPPEVFLEDIEFTMGRRRAMTRACLERDDWDLLFAVFSCVDRVQHVMYHYADPEHPRHDPTEAARKVHYFGREVALKEVIDATYVQMDAIVGEVMATLHADDQLLICADHGFTSFRRGFRVNNWLAREGYLVPRPPSGGKLTAGLMGGVDWSRTRAYSLGFGMIYLNLRGREPKGIVPKEQARALLEELRTKLLGVTDPGPAEAPYDVPRRVVLDAEIMQDLYSGGEIPWGSRDWPCADLMIGLAEYYRVAWEGVGGELRFAPGERKGRVKLASDFVPNQSPWSGDHASTSPSVVTGAFFSRRPLEIPPTGVSVMHIAPTVLEGLGVAIPQTMELEPLRPR